jgi:hypothetical protein
VTWQKTTAGAFESDLPGIRIESQKIRHVVRPIDTPERKRYGRRRLTARRHRKKYQAKAQHRYRLRA